MGAQPKTLFIYKSKEQSLSESSTRSVEPQKQYRLSTSIVGNKGLPYSAYLCAIILDSNNRERARHVRWINDFSGEQKEYTMTFTTDAEARKAVIGYRVNIETPVRSEIVLILPDVSMLQLEQLHEKKVPDDYDELGKFRVPVLPPLTPTQEELLEKKIVWIFGAPRSGTTWLGIRLLKHEQTIVWNEPWIGYHLAAIFTGEDPQKDRPKFDRLLDLRSDIDEYFFGKVHKSNWLPALRKLILARTYSQAQLLSKNIIIKEPAGSYSVDLLLECLPKSKMIFLLRDGRDVVESRLDAEETLRSKSLGEEKLREKRYRAIQLYSIMWNMIIDVTYKAYEKHDPALRLLVRYEQLKTDTFTELKKIYQFIGIGISDEDLKRKAEYYDFKNIPDSEKGSGKFNRAATTGAWRNTFSKREIELMNSIMGDTLKKMGYGM